MDLVTVKPFPDLPIDVARYLLETAAWEDPCTAQALTRISKVVRQWIDPILYHTVTLHTLPQLSDFTISISARNSPAFFARSVKILRLGAFTLGAFKYSDGRIVSSNATTELVRIVLNECSGVRRLAFWLQDGQELLLHAFTVVSGYSPSHLSMLDMPAQRLTLDEYVKFVPPSLTHLHLDHGSSTGDNVQSIPWQAFAACPGLSHICLSGPIAQCFLDPSDRDFISLATDQLAALPSNIVIFVLYVDYLPLLNKQIDINSVSSDLETLSAASDRLVAMADRHYRGQIANLHCFLEYRDIGADWGDGGAKDIWEYADICLIKQRRNREAKLVIRDGE
ncbi:hypothetical protein BDZ89DRAFT_1086358 [Hymenopellis radicata]|nr:hypothetical protein BDZ89DRAFT_1086358 [Hymenopellis radicata]